MMNSQVNLPAYNPIGAAVMPDATAAPVWNMTLDRAAEYCVMYWSDCGPGGPAYIDNLYEMTLCAVDMSWEDVCRSIRRALEKIPGLGLTFATANEKALVMFALYRNEVQSRGGEWNRPFPHSPNTTSLSLIRTSSCCELWPEPSEHRRSNTLLTVAKGEVVAVGSSELKRDKLARKDFTGLFNRDQKEGEDLHVFF
jgi:hypothetical protein